MEKENKIELKVYGKYALFTDPITRAGGEKFTYQIPTYQALKGILESVYWKPTFTWIIDECRIMKPIQTKTQGVRPLLYDDGKNTLAYYTYLRDVEYQIKAHFEWNENRPELACDRNENKHFFIAKRMLERGGRRDIFLGTRECQAYVEPCIFGEEEGFYDEIEELAFGMMVHGITYPDEAKTEGETGKLIGRFWNPVMKKGVITFIRPEECTLNRTIGSGKRKEFNEKNFSGLKEFEKEGEIFELE